MTDLLYNPIIISVPLFGLFIGLEFLYCHYKKSSEYNDRIDTWSNIGIGFVSLFFGVLFGSIFGFAFTFCYELSPFKLPYDAWWAWGLALFLDDFLYYWFHRVSHESRFWWNFHVVHHSSEEYNLSVAVRQSWFGNSVAWMFYIPMALLGFPFMMRLSVHGFNLIYQFFIHTNFVRNLGFLEYFMNTPSHHRVHHGVNNPYLDKNYGGIFIIWDRLFGTFIEETDPPRYGIIKPIRSYNWLWINTHAWVEMFDSMKKRKTLFGKIRCIFSSPNLDY